MTTRVSGLLPSCPLAAAVRSLQLSVRCCPVRRNGAVVINNKLQGASAGSCLPLCGCRACRFVRPLHAHARQQ